MEHVAYAEQLGSGIGLLQLRNLDLYDAPNRIQSLINWLGNIDALIVDLREAEGKSFEAGVNTVPLFLKSGTISKTKRKRQEGRLATSVIELREKNLEWRRDHPPAQPKASRWQRLPHLTGGVPTALLIGNLTGTAAGIIALALRNNKAASLWGMTATLRAPTNFCVTASGAFLRPLDAQQDEDLWNTASETVECEPHFAFEQIAKFGDALVDHVKEELIKYLTARPAGRKA